MQAAQASGASTISGDGKVVTDNAGSPLGGSQPREKGEGRTASHSFRNLGVIDAWEGHAGVREQRGRTVLFVPPECGTCTCHPCIVDDTGSSITCELIRT